MTVRRLFLLTFALALFVLPVRPTLDSDMWWHLETGQYILEHGIPRQDLFSFTAPDHEWITHEWLADVLMALVYRAGGLPALMLVFAGLGALAFWLVYVRCVGRPYLAAFVTLLGVVAAGGSLGVRPQMFNLLGLAAFVNLVEGVKDRRFGRRILVLLPLLTAVWVNLHSGYLLGVVLLGVYVVGEALQMRFGPPTQRGLDWLTIRWLAVTTVLCFGAAIINPNGYRLWIYPFETLGSNAMQTFILEWKSPNFHLSVFWPFGIMLVAGLLSLVFSPRRPTWTDTLLFFGTAIAALNSTRHITIFTIVAIPIMSRYALGALAAAWPDSILQDARSESSLSRLQTGLHWGLVALLIFVAIIKVYDTMRNNEAAIAAQYPAAAADFLEQQGWRERPGFNDYNWGGYLIWRGWSVFVDGRADVYRDEFFRYYLQTLQAQPAWQEPLDDFEIDYVLVRRDVPLTVLLTESEEWREAYADDLAQVFVRAE